MKGDEREWAAFLNARRGLFVSGVSGIFTTSAEDKALKIDFEAAARMHPTHLPLGFDVETLKQERNRLQRAKADQAIHNLLQKYAERNRINLSDLMQNPKAYLSQQNTSDAFNTLLKIRKIGLLQEQKVLRRNVYRGIKEILSPHLLSAANTSTAHLEENLYDLRALSELETRHLAAGEAKKVAWWLGTMKLVRQAALRMAQMQKDQTANQQRIFIAVNAIHDKHKKEEEKAKKKAERARIQALKSNDEQEYLKLIRQEKNTRLTHILQKTDEYIALLKARIRLQQGSLVGSSSLSNQNQNQNQNISSLSNQNQNQNQNISSLSNQNQNQNQNLSNPNQNQNQNQNLSNNEALPSHETTDYFDAAHSAKEQIKEQPRSVAYGQLREYQLKGVEWMVSLYNNSLNGILADEMGLGKTVQAIVFICYLLEKKQVNLPFLVVVPLSTFSNWSSEFARWAPGIKVLAYKGDPSQRRDLKKETLTSHFNVLLTTFEYVIRDRAFLSKISWLYTIVDEGHRMKNAGSKLCTVMNTYYKSKFRLLLTGTPLQNSLPELWSLLNFVLPKIFCAGGSFDEWFSAPVAHAGEKIDLNEEEELLIIKRLHKVLRPFLLRRLKKDVEAGLPEKVETVIKCRMSGLQRSLYNEVRSAAANKQEGTKRLNNTIMQLRKICNHPFVFSTVEEAVNPAKVNNEMLYRVSGKFELVRRMLHKLCATGHKVLVFFQMTQVMTIMEDMLVMEGVKYLRLDGAVKAEERAELIAQFSDTTAQHSVFLLSTRAGGLGLNLQAADTVIIFDSDWNPHADQQAQDRAHRIGQTQEVRIFRLVTADSIEEYILQKATHKLHVDEKIIQAGRFDNRTTHEEREALLRNIFEGEGGEGDDSLAVTSDADLNRVLARTPAELAALQEMDAGGLGPTELYAGPAPSLLGAELQEVAEEETGPRRRKSAAWAGRRQARVIARCEEILESIMRSTESGRRRAVLFEELPDPSIYPDYYEYIQSPISLAEIRDNLESYANVAEFASDVRKMCDNAMAYNAEGSAVYRDAEHFLVLLETLTEE
ncbi:ATP-dependent helicase STH1/SNF2 [Nematocida homosporus]|uniref:ATP-dependent helicase STH1/SNF2 n=1 Tax=Nematocida homosporus TaxID=1912981 RepID=UPI00221FD74C|nr:ATP-dependent helicase STH1/SNF2 [Nematocida homosporus]KAI5184932.1 ATP-dependent helicase STH1/SNF2 [Nematocida homosporus]